MPQPPGAGSIQCLSGRASAAASLQLLGLAHGRLRSAAPPHAQLPGARSNQCPSRGANALNFSFFAIGLAHGHSSDRQHPPLQAAGVWRTSYLLLEPERKHGSLSTGCKLGARQRSTSSLQAQLPGVGSIEYLSGGASAAASHLAHGHLLILAAYSRSQAPSARSTQCPIGGANPSASCKPGARSLARTCSLTTRPRLPGAHSMQMIGQERKRSGHG